MKSKPNIKLFITIVSVALAIACLESKRQQNIRLNRNVTAKVSKTDTTNTDYIFFQAVSKYLYIPLIK